MLTVYYSPHSTSIDNEASLASGHADPLLSPVGREQAQKLGQHYAAEALDAIFCSDLQRAYTTAEIAFSARNLPMFRDARLRECDYGRLTQHPTQDVEQEQHLTEPFPGGESVWMVVQRVGAFLQDALRDYDGKTILVVGHAATRHALEYWSGDASLEDIVRTPWKWRDVPIWRYEFDSPLRAT